MSDAFEDGAPGGVSLPFFYVGEVVDRRDPERLGRVRVRIPGIVEPASAWAKPLGVGGGAKNRGIFFVPALGAEVGVFFNQGNPDEPHFMAAHWGKPGGVSEVPEEAQVEEPDVVVLATEDFRIEVNNAEGTRKLRLSNLRTGDVVWLDAQTNEIMVAATTRLTLKAIGAIDIDAAVITIGGRPVRLGIDEAI